MSKTLKFIIGILAGFLLMSWWLNSGSSLKEERRFREQLENVLPKDKDNFDFTSVVLGLSSIIDPESDYKKASDEISAMTAELKPVIMDDIRADAVMNNINNFIFKDKGFRFDEKANAFMSGSELAAISADDFLNFNSIPRVLERRQGICLSLSLIYLMIADKLKLPIYGVLVPGHIFVRYQEPGHSGINSETTFGGVEYYGYKELTNTGFIDASKVIYNKPLSRYDTVAAALNNMGILLMRTGAIPKAEIMLEKSIEMLPDFPETHNNLGLIYDQKKQYEKAEAEFTESLRLFPNYSNGYVNLASLYTEQGRWLLAENNLEKALNIDPNNRLAAAALEELNRKRKK